jgi:CRP-like cAMP-binding protein
MMGRMSDSKLLASLDDEERQRLAPYLQVVELQSGQTLLEAGTPIESVWFPHNCVTSTVVDTPEGATIEVGLMGMEGLVGLSLLLGAPNSNTTVIVQIPGHATRMKATDFVEQIVRPHGEAFQKLLRYADAFMAMVAQTAACNSLHDVDQRLARWILMTNDRVGRNEIPLTQEFLAYMLGVRRASVSVAASSLQQMGLIRYSRGQVTVVNREGLEENSCACYGIVRNITDELFKEERAA